VEAAINPQLPPSQPASHLDKHPIPLTGIVADNPHLLTSSSLERIPRPLPDSHPFALGSIPIDSNIITDLSKWALFYRCLYWQCPAWVLSYLWAPHAAALLHVQPCVVLVASFRAGEFEAQA
jgi:hypothetical protein